jgi:hypothetical protein
MTATAERLSIAAETPGLTAPSKRSKMLEVRRVYPVLRRLPLTFVLLGAVSAWGQNAISARSGMVHYVEGRVLLDGKAIEPKFAEFPQVSNDQTLATEEGRVEVLLTPGVFLRLSEDSSFRMLSNRLSDTALEIVSGSALFEVDELLKDNAITVHFKNASIQLLKQGLYRFDADLGRMRVYDGEAQVSLGERNLTAKKGKQVAFGDTLVASNFDTKITDPFYRWASRRSEYVATANVSAARSASSNGLVSNYGSWAWNPWFGMFTFLPGTGYGYNPFGWAFYSPYTIGYLYNPYLYTGGYYSGVATNGGGPATTFNGNAGAAGLAAARSTPPSFNSGAASPGVVGGGGPVGGGSVGAAAHAGGGGVAGGAVGGGGSRGGR